MSQKLAEGYSNIPRSFRRITESKLEQKVPQKIVDTWSSLSIVLRVADNHLDSGADTQTRLAFIANSLKYLRNECDHIEGADDCLLEASEKLRHSLNLLERDSVSTFIKTLGRLCRVSEHVKSADTIQQYSKWRRLEGQINARALTSLLPCEFREHTNFRPYLKFMTRLGRSVNMFDSLVDLRSDAQNKEVEIEPTLHSYAVITKDMVRDSAYVIRNLNMGLYTDMCKGVIGAINRR